MCKIEVEDLIGAPFEWLGNGNPGFDCYTLAQEVARRAGIELPDKKDYVDKSIRNILMEESKVDFQKVEKPEPYCIVAFAKFGKLFHVGTVLSGCTTFMHIRKPTGVIISHLNDPFYRFLREGFYRVKCNHS